MNRNQELLERAKKGDRAAEETLVEENMRLVFSVAGRFRSTGYEMEDLVQLGSIGLVKAIKKFDLSYDVKLSTYAVPMILGEIRRFLRDDGMLKVSRSVKETAMHAARYIDALRIRLGREPTIAEVAAESGLPEESLIEALDASAPVESIDKGFSDSDGNETPLPVGGANPEDSILNHVMVETMLNSLKPRERTILELRYFRGKTQSEIAKMIGISQVQVSRIEKSVLLKLREEQKN